MYKVHFRSEEKRKHGFVIENNRGEIVNDLYFKTREKAGKYLDLLKAMGYAK